MGRSFWFDYGKTLNTMNIKIFLVLVPVLFGLAVAMDNPISLSTIEDLKNKGAINITSLSGHDGWIACVALSPDGRLAASVSIKLTKYSTVKIWDIAKGECLWTFEADFFIRSVVFSPNSDLVAVGGNNGNVCVWSLAESNYKKILKFDEIAWVYTLAFISNGVLRISGFKRNDCYNDFCVSATYDLSSSSYDVLYSESVNSGKLMACNPCSNLVALVTFYNEVAVFNYDTFGYYNLFSWLESVWVVAISSNDKFIASGSINGMINIWNLHSKSGRKFKGHNAKISSILFSPNDNFMITASYDNTIALWDTETGKLVGRIKCKDRILAMSMTLTHLIVGFPGGSVEIYTNTFVKKEMLSFLMSGYSIQGDNSPARVLTDPNLKRLLYGWLGTLSWEDIFCLAKPCFS